MNYENPIDCKVTFNENTHQKTTERTKHAIDCNETH